MHQDQRRQRHQADDHALLARSYAKAIGMFLDDLWEWSEREVAKLIAELDLAPYHNVDGQALRTTSRMKNDVDEIRLRNMNRAVETLRVEIKKVNQMEYRDPLEAVDRLHAGLQPVLSVVRACFAIRQQTDAILEAFEDRVDNGGDGDH